MPLHPTFERGEVALRAPWPNAPEVVVALVGYGPEDARSPVLAVSPVRVDGRTEFHRPGVVEWWERGPDGLEQGFVLDEPPSGGRIVLELALRGAHAVVDPDGRSATFEPDRGGGLRYEGLVAWDEAGTDLPAWMVATQGGLELVVDVEGAVGAVTVDPVLPGVAWGAVGGAAGASLGASVASAGDVNGDGFDDVLVGAPEWGGAQDEGEALLYLGSATGPGAVAAWIFEGGQAMARAGASVASAGDVNGDGFDDVVVGAPGYTDTFADEGVVAVFHGSAAGLSAAPAWVEAGGSSGAGFGASVASAGDTNGDGYDDLVALAPDDVSRPGFFDVGSARVFLGAAGGLRRAPAWTVVGDSFDGVLGAVSSAGDVNGDGYDDVAVGSPTDLYDYGAVDVYHGSATGPSATVSTHTWVFDPVFGSDGTSLGAAVSPAGDVNGDGYGDLIAGGPTYSGFGADLGGAWVFYGSAAGLPNGLVTADWRALGEDAYARFGSAVAAAGDVNGDGFSDVVVGAPGQDDQGEAVVYLGSATGLAVVPAATLRPYQTAASFGASVGAGDFDGDNLTDLLIGAPGFDAGSIDQGGAFVYLDVLADTDGDGIPLAEDLCPDLADPAQADGDGDGVGDACDDPVLEVVGAISPGAPVSLVAAGLVPGEVVRFGGAVGPGALGPCPAYLGGLCLDLGAGAVDLGTATAGATGVAVLGTNVPGAVQVGGTYVIQAAVRRGVGGVSSAKSDPLVLDASVLDWDADGLTDAVEQGLGTDPANPDTDADGLLDGEELLPFLDPLDDDRDGDGVLDGADLCLAGDDAADLDLDAVPDRCDRCPADSDPAQADADGDGLGDACEGAVLLASGWVESGAREDFLGDAVASAGDVNGDGYDDVVVGVPNWLAPGGGNLRRFGRALVFHGSAGGLLGAPAWSTQGTVNLEEVGASVASAGDVNGDGYDDVIVGAPSHDGALNGEGAAAVFLGSPAGLAVAPAWTAVGGQALARFGEAVASAGDVNGDGYDDVVVGAPAFDVGGAQGAGTARLYLGWAQGLRPTPAFTVLGDEAGAGLGGSVASAGDVNGDGYDEVVVGADGADVVEDEGAAALFLGSALGLSATPAWTVRGEARLAHFGVSVASAGDLNGDGFDEVVVGQAEGTLGGSVSIFRGSASGLATTATWRIASDGGLGTAVAPAGDVNGDGYADLLAGAPWGSDSPQFYWEGLAVLVLGSSEGPASAPAWVGSSNQGLNPYSNVAAYGRALAGAGDVDGDGLSDVIVGAPGYDTAAYDAGRAWVYLGQAP